MFIFQADDGRKGFNLDMVLDYKFDPGGESVTEAIKVTLEGGTTVLFGGDDAVRLHELLTAVSILGEEQVRQNYGQLLKR